MTQVKAELLSFPWRACSAFVLAGLGCGCGPTMEAGLANAPSARRNSPPRRQHDVISNGPDSCGAQEPGAHLHEPPCAGSADGDADAGVGTPSEARRTDGGVR